MRSGLIAIWCCLFYSYAGAQTKLPADTLKPAVPKSELKQLTGMADSLMLELKKLYKLELASNASGKYQPERISLIRTYLLLFDYVQRRCEVATFNKADVLHIFGKPDSIAYSADKTNTRFYYNTLIKKYVRIVNLRYRFYFKGNELIALKREEAY
jgi:hypothetical protein